MKLSDNFVNFLYWKRNLINHELEKRDMFFIIWVLKHIDLICIMGKI